MIIETHTQQTSRRLSHSTERMRCVCEAVLQVCAHASSFGIFYRFCVLMSFTDVTDMFRNVSHQNEVIDGNYTEIFLILNIENNKLNANNIQREGGKQSYKTKL